MSLSELCSLGEALYGPPWQTKLARALPISTRTLRYWLAGKRQIRPLVAKRIRALPESWPDMMWITVPERDNPPQAEPP